MVFRDKQIYLAEANRQLTDDRFYKRLDSDRTEEFSAPITDTLNKMYENDVVKKLLLTNCRLDQLYLLPNIPKKGMHGRPIDTAIVHPTEKISEFTPPFISRRCAIISQRHYKLQK